MKALLAAGGFIDDKYTLHYLNTQGYDKLFAIDGGLDFFHRQKLVPDYIIGDFDSVKETILHEFLQNGKSKVVRLNPMKDDTDTGHALQMAISMGFDTIHLFGATGTRMDHVLGNLQLLGIGLKQGIVCEIIDPWNKIRLINKEIVLTKETSFGRYVSLIPYTPEVKGLNLTGFLYPLTDAVLNSFYMPDAVNISGVSNEIIDDEAKITMESGILVLVESRD